MHTPFFSIIIPTINRIDVLGNLFKSILRTQEKNIEIIVVDQNQNGLIDTIIEHYAGLLPINHQKVNFSGLSKARNYGIKFAQGTYILFPDDDCEFFENCFDIIYAELQKRDIDVLCGKTVDRTMSDSVTKFSKSAGFLTLQKHSGMFIESTMVIKRNIMDLFYFDEMLGAGTFYGSNEGYDLVLRMLKENINIYYTPDFLIYHPNKILAHCNSDEIRRSFYYSTGYASLCKKHSLQKKYYSRLVKLLLYIPYCFFLRRSKTKFYLVELSGLIAGYIV